MKNKAVFLDRDGTINVDKHYLFRIEEFEFLPGAIKGLQLLQQAGFLLIIITNQSGIGRGYYSEEDFAKLNQWMIDILKSKGVFIQDVFYCPHLPNAKVLKYRKTCLCRKPGVELFEKAVRKYDIDLNRSWAIGDNARDCAICLNSGCRGILINSGEKKNITKSEECDISERIMYADSLLECSQMIVSGEKK